MDLFKQGMKGPTRPAPKVPLVHRYSPVTNWDQDPFSTDVFEPTPQQKKKPPPRPPPPKIKQPDIPSKPSHFIRRPTVLSSLLSRKHKPPSHVNQIPEFIEHDTNRMFPKCEPKNVQTGSLIDLSPPSSPTFTTRSSSDGLSVDSFGSDATTSTNHLNNCGSSQAESGFEDDFDLFLSTRKMAKEDTLDNLSDPFSPQIKPPIMKRPVIKNDFGSSTNISQSLSKGPTIIRAKPARPKPPDNSAILKTTFGNGFPTTMSVNTTMPIQKVANGFGDNYEPKLWDGDISPDREPSPPMPSIPPPPPPVIDDDPNAWPDDVTQGYDVTTAFGDVTTASGDVTTAFGEVTNAYGDVKAFGNVTKAYDVTKSYHVNGHTFETNVSHTKTFGEVSINNMKAFGEASSNMKPFGEASSNMKPFGEASSNMKPFGEASSIMKPFGEVSSSMKPFGEASNNTKQLNELGTHTKAFGNVSNHMTTYGDDSSHMKPFSESNSHIKPFSEVNSHIKPFGEANSNLKPFSEASSNMKPFSEVNSVTYQDEQPYAIALFDYSTDHPDDLCFSVNTKISLIRRVDNEWLYGRLRSGAQGLFPSNYVEIKVPLPTETLKTPTLGTAVALYDFEADQPGDLRFVSGSNIVVLSKLNDEWYYGECEGRKGQFPINYVRMS